MSVHKKYQPIRSNRLVGQRKHSYECLVLLYRLYIYIYVYTYTQLTQLLIGNSGGSGPDTGLVPSSTLVSQLPGVRKQNKTRS